MENKKQSFYSKNAGFSMFSSTVEKDVKNGKQIMGKVMLEFFTINDNTDNIKFMMKPSEAHSLSRGLKQLLQTQKEKETIEFLHKFNGSVSKVLLVKNTSRGNIYYNIAIFKDDKKISCPINQTDMYFLIDFARELALNTAVEKFVPDS